MAASYELETVAKSSNLEKDGCALSCAVLFPRGVTEGVTLLLLALQTGLLDMQAPQRTLLLSIILFIVVTSTLQSMIEITDPVILALGASRNRYLPHPHWRRLCERHGLHLDLCSVSSCRSVWKHVRGLSMCLLLLVFPVYMAYKISLFFHMDFWLLILVSSCMLTSLQVKIKLNCLLNIEQTLMIKSTKPTWLLIRKTYINDSVSCHIAFINISISIQILMYHPFTILVSWL